MPPGDSVVPPIRIEPVGGARGAFAGQVDARPVDAGFEERPEDGAREIDRLLTARMRMAERRVELGGHVGADRKTAGVNTGSDDRPEPRPIGTLRDEALDRSCGDPRACASPAGMENRGVAPVLGDDHDRGAVGGGDRHPGIAASDDEAVGLRRRLRWPDEPRAVNLTQEGRRLSWIAENGAKGLAIPAHRFRVVADAEAHVERSVGAAASADETSRHAEPRARRKRALGRTPEGKCGFVRGRGGFLHGPEGARRAWNAQANCAAARLLVVVATATYLAAGCAHAPAATSAAEARARLLADRAAAAAGAPIRGVGDVDADIAGRGGSFEARWGAAGESLVVIGYSGPIRVLDASLLRDSVFVAIRPKEFGVAGLIRPADGFGADGLRFLLRPWDFGPRWVREAIERASADPMEGGWRLRGEGETDAGRVTFGLDITARGEPRRLEISRPGDVRGAAVVRYGALRTFAAGRYPRWIEWTRDDARVRLDLREVAPLPGGTLRLLPPASREWRIVGLDDPEGRELLGRLVGDSTGDEKR